jgi:hypothetical protein
MPFALSNQNAKLAHMNTRAEQAGADKVSAADFKFQINVGAEKLAGFAPDLGSFLFGKNGAGGDLADQTHPAPDLRFPRLGPLDWNGEIVGATLTVHYGTGGKSDVVLGDAKVNKFTIAPQEGGTSIITFRVQAHPDEKQIGKLFGMIQRDVEISLEGPDFSDDEDDEGEED